MTSAARSLTPDDLVTLRWATQHLEHPSLAARLTSVVGTPIEMAVKLLPRPLYRRIHQIADKAIANVLESAIVSLPGPAGTDPRLGYYRGLVAASGALGGAFGLLGLALELPVSTALMLRSIAAIAQTQGEDIDNPTTRLACLEVFALGGHAPSDDAAETGYYGVRLALALSVSSAFTHIAKRGLSTEGAPLLVGLMRAISSRFGVVVSEKVAAQTVPAISAVGGAAINLIFMSHYQEMARGHFVVRHLERKYGAELVQAEYERLCKD
jgi:hypothetical protein